MAVTSTIASVGLGVAGHISGQRAARSTREENRVNRANEISIRNQEIAAQNANNRASLEAQYNFAQAQIAIAQAQHAVNDYVYSTDEGPTISVIRHQLMEYFSSCLQ